MLLPLLTIVAIAAAPAARACEVAIAFAIDVSGSISDQDYRVQMEGLAEGLRDPMVAHALYNGNSAVLVLLWSGHQEQLVAIDWRQMQTQSDVAQFATDVASLPRPWSQSATALGEALDAAAAAMTRAPRCERYVLDISGDGRSNEGVLPELTRESLAAVNLTVNAIVVDTEGGDVHNYYRDRVIHGPDSFSVTVAHVDDYASQMRRKLYRELAIQLASAE
ncbi:DUF1194 domain-containing protein [Rhodobacterales bacterium HKCCE2091]|nr:DUF1194 domain-containing protein [Rhodobacterales bacterium HKCCE2091]